MLILLFIALGMSWTFGLPRNPNRSDGTPESPAIFTNTIYLPWVPIQPSGIYGYVTENGLPAANVEISLILNYLRPYIEMTVMTDTTQENGLYQFLGAPTIKSCPDSPYCQQAYLVQYLNQSGEPGHLDYWRSNRIYNYDQGSTLNISNFDIGLPHLIAPADGDIVTSPVNFSWARRPVQEDEYSLLIEDKSFIKQMHYQTANLGWVDGYRLDIEHEVCVNAPQWPCSAWYGIPLQWKLLIHNATGDTSINAEGSFTISP